MITVKFFNNKYFYTTVTLFLILLIFEDTTLYRLYEMKKELNEITNQNKVKSIEIKQVKEKTTNTRIQQKYDVWNARFYGCK